MAQKPQPRRKDSSVFREDTRRALGQVGNVPPRPTPATIGKGKSQYGITPGTRDAVTKRLIDPAAAVAAVKPRVPTPPIPPHVAAALSHAGTEAAPADIRHNEMLDDLFGDDARHPVARHLETDRLGHQLRFLRRGLAGVKGSAALVAHIDGILSGADLHHHVAGLHRYLGALAAKGTAIRDPHLRGHVEAMHDNYNWDTLAQNLNADAHGYQRHLYASDAEYQRGLARREDAEDDRRFLASGAGPTLELGDTDTREETPASYMRYVRETWGDRGHHARLARMVTTAAKESGPMLTAFSKQRKKNYAPLAALVDKLHEKFPHLEHWPMVSHVLMHPGTVYEESGRGHGRAKRGEVKYDLIPGEGGHPVHELRFVTRGKTLTFQLPVSSRPEFEEAFAAAQSPKIVNMYGRHDFDLSALPEEPTQLARPKGLYGLVSPDGDWHDVPGMYLHKETAKQLGFDSLEDALRAGYMHVASHGYTHGEVHGHNPQGEYTALQLLAFKKKAQEHGADNASVHKIVGGEHREFPVRLAKRVTKADKKEIETAVAHQPYFALHDWLMERPEFLHDGETLGNLMAAHEHGVPVTVARHPTTGRVAAWGSDGEKPHTADTIRARRRESGRAPVGDPHTLFHGPGGVWGVRPWRSEAMRSTYHAVGRYDPDTGEIAETAPTEPGPPSYRGQAYQDAADAIRHARSLAWPKPTKLARLDHVAGALGRAVAAGLGHLLGSEVTEGTGLVGAGVGAATGASLFGPALSGVYHRLKAWVAKRRASPGPMNDKTRQLMEDAERLVSMRDAEEQAAPVSARALHTLRTALRTHGYPETHANDPDIARFWHYNVHPHVESAVAAKHPGTLKAAVGRGMDLLRTHGYLPAPPEKPAAEPPGVTPKPGDLFGEAPPDAAPPPKPKRRRGPNKPKKPAPPTLFSEFEP